MYQERVILPVNEDGVVAIKTSEDARTYLDLCGNSQTVPLCSFPVSQYAPESRLPRAIAGILQSDQETTKIVGQDSPTFDLVRQILIDMQRGIIRPLRQQGNSSARIGAARMQEIVEHDGVVVAIEGKVDSNGKVIGNPCFMSRSDEVAPAVHYPVIKVLGEEFQRVSGALSYRCLIDWLNVVEKRYGSFAKKYCLFCLPDDVMLAVTERAQVGPIEPEDVEIQSLAKNRHKLSSNWWETYARKTAESDDPRGFRYKWVVLSPVNRTFLRVNSEWKVCTSRPGYKSRSHTHDEIATSHSRFTNQVIRVFGACVGYAEVENPFNDKAPSEESLKKWEAALIAANEQHQAPFYNIPARQTGVAVTQ